MASNDQSSLITLFLMFVLFCFGNPLLDVCCSHQTNGITTPIQCDNTQSGYSPHCDKISNEIQKESDKISVVTTKEGVETKETQQKERESLEELQKSLAEQMKIIQEANKKMQQERELLENKLQQLSNEQSRINEKKEKVKKDATTLVATGKVPMKKRHTPTVYDRASSKKHDIEMIWKDESTSFFIKIMLWLEVQWSDLLVRIKPYEQKFFVYYRQALKVSVVIIYRYGTFVYKYLRDYFGDLYNEAVMNDEL